MNINYQLGTYAPIAPETTQEGINTRQAALVKPTEVKRIWYVVDGADRALSCLTTEVASVLRRKHKPTYTPSVNCGDFAVITDADKIELTRNKLNTKKYYDHPGYIGGLRTRTIYVTEDNYTVERAEKAIYGMLPHIKLGSEVRRHLFVYEGSEHPHTAQKSVELRIKGQEE